MNGNKWEEKNLWNYGNNNIIMISEVTVQKTRERN